MNSTHKHPVLQGAAAGALLSLAIILTSYAVNYDGPEETDGSQKFKVIDSYHSCDIVRYTDPSNRFHYFMDCKNGKPD